MQRSISVIRVNTVCDFP